MSRFKKSAFFVLGALGIVVVFCAVSMKMCGVDTKSEAMDVRCGSQGCTGIVEVPGDIKGVPTVRPEEGSIVIEYAVRGAWRPVHRVFNGGVDQSYRPTKFVAVKEVRRIEFLDPAQRTYCTMSVGGR